MGIIRRSLVTCLGKKKKLEKLGLYENFKKKRDFCFVISINFLMYLECFVYTLILNNIRINVYILFKINPNNNNNEFFGNYAKERDFSDHWVVISIKLWVFGVLDY